MGIIKVVEKDVNGCGEDAEVYVSCSETITDAILTALEEILSTVKEGTPVEEWDTDSLVAEAVERFNSNNDAQLEIINSPVVAEF
ncbi:MAG: hypothetical protein E7422_10260 [Ruminococcaceae bacterium]|nr:hypothetical protein [Oscillospiraceae bacterium]